MNCLQIVAKLAVTAFVASCGCGRDAMQPVAPAPGPPAVSTPAPSAPGKEPAPSPPMQEPLPRVEGVPDLPLADLASSAPDSTAAVAFENREGLRAYDAKDYQAAIDHFKKALERDPRHLPSRYNLACVFALSGKTDDAIALLGQLGHAKCEACRAQVAKAAGDPDFDAVKSDPRFQKLLTASAAFVEPVKPAAPQAP